MNDEVWGPWIQHDGKGCRCVGAFAKVEWLCIQRGVMVSILPCVRGEHGWVWDRAPTPGLYGAVVRYRIKKPRGMTILENLLADLPAPVEPVK